MNHKWKENEIEFLIQNYPTFGLNYCIEKLNLQKQSIKSKICSLKLNIKIENKTDISLFENINSKEVSYILGLLWADGNVNNSFRNYEIRIDANEKDMLEIENTIMKTGSWKKYIIKGQFKKNNTIRYKIGFKKLYNIFKGYDFNSKSKVSPTKLLSKIPDKLKHYFFLGIIDGDGCFYINKKNYTYQFTISSTYEQNWEYMIELCEKLNISKYRIDLCKNLSKENKITKYSSFRICRKSDIKIIGDYIYQNYNSDQIGLKRKNMKYNTIN